MGRCICLGFLVIVLVPCGLWPQVGAVQRVSGSASIVGRVVDETGRPVKGAAVICQPVDHPDIGLVPLSDSGKPIRPLTDTNGEFVLQNVPVGRDRVCASKEAEGYPDTTAGWFRMNAPCPILTIREGQALERVVVRLGPKAPRLSGRVVDTSTGAPVTPAYVRAYEGSVSPAFIPTGADKEGRFQLLVPFDEPFRLQADAPGYVTWYYGTDGTKEHEAQLVLQRGAAKEVEIKLRRAKP